MTHSALHTVRMHPLQASQNIFRLYLGSYLKKNWIFSERRYPEPERPFTAIIGGAKVKDKIGVIDHLLDKVDNLIIGGGLSYTFTKAQGYEIGNSLA